MAARRGPVARDILFVVQRRAFAGRSQKPTTSWYVTLPIGCECKFMTLSSRATPIALWAGRRSERRRQPPRPGWDRPMTYQLTAPLVRGRDGRLREVRVDRLLEGAYAATVEVEGPQGRGLVDARCSDALNLAAMAGAPVLASAEILAECVGRQEGHSAEAARPAGPSAPTR